MGTGVDGVVDLQHTYVAAVAYLDAQRAGHSDEAPGLMYELVWVDNGGDREAHAAFLARGAQFEVARRNPSNEGLFRAVNDVWFRGLGCRAPYVLSLEDDWVVRPDLVSSRIPHLALSMEILHGDATLSGVRLKDEWSDELLRRKGERKDNPYALGETGGGVSDSLNPVLKTTTNTRLPFLRHCMALDSGFIWGAFSMAAVLYDRHRLHALVGKFSEGPPWDDMKYDYSEGQYAVRVGLSGLCTARPRFEDACTVVGRDNRPLQRPAHPLGPCHQIFLERRAPHARDLQDYKWFFHNVTLMRSNGMTVPPLETMSVGQLSRPSAGRDSPASTMDAIGSADLDNNHHRTAGNHYHASSKEDDTAMHHEPDREEIVGRACDGSPIKSSTHRFFSDLDSGTRLGYRSKDYTIAARALRQLAANLGGVEKVINGYGCVGVSRYYVQYLLRWELDEREMTASATQAVGSSPDVNLRQAAGETHEMPSNEQAAPLTAESIGSHDEAPARAVSSNWRSWREVAPPVSRPSHNGAIPKIIIQTWKEKELPIHFAQLALRVRRAHPTWTYILFDDRDINDFVTERQPMCARGPA